MCGSTLRQSYELCALLCTDSAQVQRHHSESNRHDSAGDKATGTLLLRLERAGRLPAPARATYGARRNGG